MGRPRTRPIVESVEAPICIGRIEIGAFRLYRYTGGKFHIFHESGEGGAFDEAKLALAIAKFFAEEF